jgi:excisionase family DNA binding protein
MMMGVSEFASQLGISPGRVRQLISAKRITATKSGGTWLIDQSQLKLRALSSRPMSKTIATNFIYLLSDMDWGDNLQPSERSRIKDYFAELKSNDNPAALLAAWLKAFRSVHKLHLNPNDFNALRAERKIVASGVSDKRTGLSQSDFFEGYVESKDLKEIKRKYLLVESDNFNVILRTSSMSLTKPIPFGLVLADLADHNQPREDKQVKALVRAI